jgi:DNA-binding NtrC family response regulator
VPVKVLIVDDEVDFLDIMAERMRARGIDVATATSAEDAIHLVGQEHYDVVIMDFMMPAMNGFKALKMLKEKKADTQIILMTGNVPGELIHQAKQNGALDVVEKPADLKTLIEKIKKASIKKANRRHTGARKK